MEPYLVVAKRTAMFEDAVMGYLGVQDAPTFDHPVSGNGTKPKGLGYACGGKKIDACHSWLQERAPKRTVEGRELKMLITEEQLTEALCRVCKKG